MKVWRIMFQYSGWRLAASVFAGIIAGAAFAALMRTIHQAVTLPQADLTSAAWGFSLLALVYFTATLISEYILIYSSEHLQSGLRVSLVRQMVAMPLPDLERIGSASLLNAISDHVRILISFMRTFPTKVVSLATVVGCFAYMCWLSPLVFALNLVFVGIAAGCYFVPGRAAARVGRAAHRASDEHLGQTQFSLRALPLLILSRIKRHDFIFRHYEPTAEQMRRLNVRYRTFHLLAERFAEILVILNLGGLLFVLPRFIVLPTATLTGLILAALFVRPSLKTLLDVVPQAQEAELLIERITECGLDPFAEVPPETRPSEHRVTFGEMQLDRVSFRYEDRPGQAGFAVGPFSFRIHRGEIVFIVGGNGAGKTTLAKLLCGLYLPSSGTIVLDGAPVKSESDVLALRDRFSAAFSDDPVFAHLLGVDPEKAEGQAQLLLERLKVSSKVRVTGSKFSTVDLSQGQRRRLALLNALLEDRPILLLDEWAADQDPEFRQFFYETLLPDLRLQGKTVILITHDDRFFGVADQIVKIDSGQIVPVAVRAVNSNGL